MKALRKRGLSPALVIAVLALVAAVGGSAVAQQATPSAQGLNKKQKKQTKKIAKKQRQKAEANSIPSKIVNRRSPVVVVANNAFGTATVSCPDDQLATGGGMAITPIGAEVNIINSGPTSDAGDTTGFGAWSVQIRNNSGIARNLRAYVNCVEVKESSGNYPAGESLFL